MGAGGRAAQRPFHPDSLVIAEAFEPGDNRLPYTEPTAVNVTDRLRLLLLGRIRSSAESCGDPRVFAELCAGPPASLPLPWPTSPAPATVARDLARAPGDPRTAEEWAQSLYVSSTSLRRAFRAETGLAFSEWRTRLRLNHSLELLAEGHLVGAVAARVGFASANGYILAFRRHFGQTPGAYMKRPA